MKRLALCVGVAMVAGLSGCTSARYVQKDQTSGVVAIPENSNVWPTNYRDAAFALIKEHLGANTPYSIVEEREVVTGGRDPANPMSPPPNATPATKEYRITYVKKPVQQGVPMGAPFGGPPGVYGQRPVSGPPVSPAGGMGMGGMQPAGGMSPGGPVYLNGGAYAPPGGPGSLPGGPAAPTGMPYSPGGLTGSSGSSMPGGMIPNVGPNSPGGSSYPFTTPPPVYPSR